MPLAGVRSAARTRVPLAWLSLVHRPSHLFAALGGVAFASTLMFVEMGFRNGLYDSHTYVVRMFNADLIIVHGHKEAVVPKLPFSRRRLTQARSVPGVVAAYPVYVEEYRAGWRNAIDGREYPILVYAIDPDDPAFLIPEVRQQVSRLKQPDTALIDSKSRNFYGRLTAGTSAELGRRTIHIVGAFPLGPDFRTDGSAIVSDRTFFTRFADPADPAAERSRVEFGLLTVAPGRDVVAVQRDLVRALPADVRILTKAELVDLVERFWGESKPVGVVFGLGMIVGFLIGVAICYQILYTDIVDHLPQFATLKAMGFHNRQLVRIVLQKALYLGVLGFVPGLLLSLGVYAVLEAYTQIRMDLTLGRTLFVMATTVAMCLVSAAIAIRKVIESDPAEVF